MQPPIRDFHRATTIDTINRTVTIEGTTVVMTDTRMNLDKSNMPIRHAPEHQRFPFADWEKVQRCFDEKCQQSIADGFMELGKRGTA